MKVVSKREGLKVKETTHIRMALNTKGSGKRDSGTVMALSIMRHFTDTKGNGKKGIKMEEVSAIFYLFCRSVLLLEWRKI